MANQLTLDAAFQAPVIDAAEARSARNAAIDAVDEHAPPAFKDAADEAIRRVAASRATFIVDDVWEAMGTDWEAVPDKRAIGGRFRAAVNAGLIRPTADHRPSAQVKCHANPRRVWASCQDSKAGGC